MKTLRRRLLDGAGATSTPAPTTYTLSVSKIGAGNGDVWIGSSKTITSTTVNSGGSQTIHAEADSNSEFKGWKNSATAATNVSTNKDYTVTVSSNATYYANFEEKEEVVPDGVKLRIIPAHEGIMKIEVWSGTTSTNVSSIGTFEHSAYTTTKNLPKGTFVKWKAYCTYGYSFSGKPTMEDSTTVNADYEIHPTSTEMPMGNLDTGILLKYAHTGGLFQTPLITSGDAKDPYEVRIRIYDHNPSYSGYNPNDNNTLLYEIVNDPRSYRIDVNNLDDTSLDQDGATIPIALNMWFMTYYQTGFEIELKFQFSNFQSAKIELGDVVGGMWTAPDGTAGLYGDPGGHASIDSQAIKLGGFKSDVSSWIAGWIYNGYN